MLFFNYISKTYEKTGR